MTCVCSCCYCTVWAVNERLQLLLLHCLSCYWTSAAAVTILFELLLNVCSCCYYTVWAVTERLQLLLLHCLSCYRTSAAAVTERLQLLLLYCLSCYWTSAAAVTALFERLLNVCSCRYYTVWAVTERLHLLLLHCLSCCWTRKCFAAVKNTVGRAWGEPVVSEHGGWASHCQQCFCTECTRNVVLLNVSLASHVCCVFKWRVLTLMSLHGNLCYITAVRWHTFTWSLPLSDCRARSPPCDSHIFTVLWFLPIGFSV